MAAPVNRTVSNVKVGTPDTTNTAPAHTPGIRQGNAPGGIDKEPGLVDEGNRATANSRRSTGVNPAGANTIDPRMPRLTPA